MMEDKSKPNPDWVNAPYEAQVLTLGRDGKLKSRIVKSKEEAKALFDLAFKNTKKRGRK
jgi:hypothetical protein